MKTLAAIAHKGGTGKTTTILELAFNLASTFLESKNRKARVLVVDLDSQGNSTKQLTGKESHKKNLFHLFSTDHLLSPKQIAAKVHSEWPDNIVVLPADDKLASLPSLLSNRPGADYVLADALSTCKDIFDYCLIDTPGGLSIGTCNALMASEWYLITACLSQYSEDSIPKVQRFINLIKKRHKIKELGILLTGYEKGGAFGVRDIIQELKQHPNFLDDYKISHTTKVLESQRKQQAIGQVSPEHKVSQQYKSLTNLFAFGES